MSNNFFWNLSTFNNLLNFRQFSPENICFKFAENDILKLSNDELWNAALILTFIESEDEQAIKNFFLNGCVFANLGNNNDEFKIGTNVL